jgi:MFS family permease
MNLACKDKAIFSVIFYIMLLLGWYMVSYGVLIPFYSAETHKDQTHYSFTFVSRSVAFILGCLTLKPLLSIFSIQTVIIGNLTLISLSLFLCSLSHHDLNLIIMLFLSAYSIIHLMILSPTIILHIFQHNQPDKWLLTVGIAFAIGASFTPYLIQIIKFHTYQLLAFLFALTIPLLLHIEIP